MATTTTLLLVLATTAGLFDLAAARCRVMMFMPGHLEELETTVQVQGIATQKDGDASKIDVLDAAVPGTFPGAGLVHAVFGKKPTYKWYAAVKALNTAAGAGAGATIDNDANGNYYVFKAKTTSTIASGDWTGTFTLDPVGNALPKEMAWIAVVHFTAGASCAVLSVYINEEPSFRSGPMRYAGYQGKAVLAAVVARSQQKFNLDLKTIGASATNARLFYGYGTFENAKVAMDVHFQIAANAVNAGNPITSAAGFVYKDFAGSNAKLTAKTADVDLKPDGDAHSLGWVAAYDVSLRKFIFYQKMTHMGDGFHNGKLTMGTNSDATGVGLEGTIVFASRDEDEFILYLPKVKLRDGQDQIRAFYGKKPWSAEMEAALDGIPNAPEDDAKNGIYLSKTGNWDVTGFTNNAVNLSLKKFELKDGDKCGMVKWVAFRQTKGGEKYLAHRDMTKNM